MNVEILLLFFSICCGLGHGRRSCGRGRTHGPGLGPGPGLRRGNGRLETNNKNSKTYLNISTNNYIYIVIL